MVNRRRFAAWLASALFATTPSESSARAANHRRREKPPVSAKKHGPSAPEKHPAAPPKAVPGTVIAGPDPYLQTVQTVADAAALWRHAMQNSGQLPPACIDARYALLCAILETSMKTNENGLFEFSRKRRTDFWNAADQLVDYLNRADVKPHIPAVKNSSGEITKKDLPGIFRDTYVQVAALCFNACEHYEQIQKSSLRSAPDDIKRASLYTDHNHPVVANVIIAKIASRGPICNLVPTETRSFVSGHNRYGKGRWAPLTVLQEILKAAQPRLDLYSRHIGYVIPAPASLKRPVAIVPRRGLLKPPGQ
ncbi:MAG: hypothetical protein AB7H77_04015 [Bdellovibrionales bacterium]